MKIQKIYCDDSNIEDTSRDRIHLNLSYGEWQKIKILVDLARWSTNSEKDYQHIKKLAKNINTMFNYAEESKPIWVHKNGVVVK